MLADTFKVTCRNSNCTENGITKALARTLNEETGDWYPTPSPVTCGTHRFNDGVHGCGQLITDIVED